MAACRQLGFDVTGNSTIRPADPENPTVEPNMNEVYRITRCGDMAIRVSWGHMEPNFGGRGGRRGSAMAPFERAIMVSYRLSIVTVALSALSFGRNLRSNVSDALINRGWVTLGPNFRLLPLD